MKIKRKTMLIASGTILATITFLAFLFVKLNPEFGESPSKEQQAKYEETGYFKDGKFRNIDNIDMNMGFKDGLKTAREFLNPPDNATPAKEPDIKMILPESIGASNSLTKVTWLGHSSLIIEIEGKTILLDPVFSKTVSPVPGVGGKRFYSQMPISVDNLPKIDAVLISHDHYDHLDYKTIKQLKSKTKHFFVPLGVDNHLKRWEVDASKISVAKWWQEFDFNGIKFAFTPAQHFSGRLFSRNNTLWGSWVIKGQTKNIFFSGDSGYGNHFLQIGEKYGPFDIALMECGQYNQKWAEIHQMPEQTVQASIDVKAHTVLPIHWGAFKLALHSWTDPAERAVAQATKLGHPIVTPMIGATLVLGKE